MSALFIRKETKELGTTVYAAYNAGTAYDPADIGLTAIPEFKRYTFNPKIFLYPKEQTTLNFGINTTLEDRTGGNIAFIKGDQSLINPFYEKNNTARISSQFELNHYISDSSSLEVKNSIGFYDRDISIPDYSFSGKQISSFTEMSYHEINAESEWIIGLNYISEKFTDYEKNAVFSKNFQQNTIGAFIQNTKTFDEYLSIESGLRTDYNFDYGLFILPRLSILYQLSPQISTRIGGGLGYKTPTVFTEEAERIQFRYVLPIDSESTDAERSAGLNFDVNYQTSFFKDQLSLSVNQLFFYTRIKEPLTLNPIGINLLEFQPQAGHLSTKGLETNVKIIYQGFKLFVGYTFADVEEHFGNTETDFPLVSKHRLNNVLFYEIEDQLKLGLEAYYFGPQQLNDGSTGRNYWITGFMAEKLWERFSLFINFENFLDTRQTRFDTIFTGSVNDPTFRDIYAPVDGFVINGGIKIRL